MRSKAIPYLVNNTANCNTLDVHERPHGIHDKPSAGRIKATDNEGNNLQCQHFDTSPIRTRVGLATRLTLLAHPRIEFWVCRFMVTQIVKLVCTGFNIQYDKREQRKYLGQTLT